MAVIRALAFVCGLGSVAILGAPLSADGARPDLPLVVTNHSDVSQCIRCVGPTLRDTGPQPIPSMAAAHEIFSIRITNIPPYGGWTCRLTTFDAAAGDCRAPPVAALDFCLSEQAVPARVDLRIAQDGQLSTAQPAHCDTEPANVAFLGVRRHRQGTDEDVYRFTAAAGTIVVARLEPDTRRHRGSEAVLTLRRRGEGSGTVFEKAVRGTVPLRVEATIPETADYELSVGQPAAPALARFRGFYRLFLHSNVLSPRLSTDQADIELAAAGAPPSPVPTDGCYTIEVSEAVEDGDFEVHNQTNLVFGVAVSREHEVLGRTTIESDATWFFDPEGGPDPLAPGIAPAAPFVIDLEARRNGAFAGSTRLLLAEIADRAMEIAARPC